MARALRCRSRRRTRRCDREDPRALTRRGCPRPAAGSLPARGGCHATVTHRLLDVASRDPVRATQESDHCLEPRPEGSAWDAGGQARKREVAAAPALQSVQPVLPDRCSSRRHLRHLVPQRRAILAEELRAAIVAGLRFAAMNLVRKQQLAIGPLVSLAVPPSALHGGALPVGFAKADRSTVDGGSSRSTAAAWPRAG